MASEKMRTTADHYRDLAWLVADDAMRSALRKLAYELDGRAVAAAGTSREWSEDDRYNG